MLMERRCHVPSRKVGPLLIAMLCIAGLAVPASAMAGSDNIYNGILDANGAWGPRHSLSSVWATWYQYDLACLNALNDSDGTWAGATVCAWSLDTNRGHLYCSCRLRWGWGGSSATGEWGGFSRGYWRQFW